MENPYQPPAVQQAPGFPLVAPGELMDIRKPALWALGLYGVSFAVGLLHDLQRSLTPDLAMDYLHLHDTYYVTFFDINALFGWLIIIPGLASMIVFFVWKYRAAHNARILNPAVMTFSPAMAVGSYFIPIANLVIPCAAMLGISRASTGGGRWVGLWWTGHLGCLLLTIPLILATWDADPTGKPVPMEYAYTLWNMLTFLFTWQLIMRITRAQTARSATTGS